MGLEKAGLQLGKKFIVWTRTSGKSLLATKPVKINTCGLKYAPRLEGDVVQFSKLGLSKANIVEPVAKEASEITKTVSEMFPKTKFKSIKEFEKYIKNKQYDNYASCYDDAERSLLTDLYKQNPDLVSLLVSREGGVMQSYNAYQIERLTALHKQYPKEVEHFVLKLKQNGDVYTASDISEYLKAAEKNPKLAQKLLLQENRFQTNDINVIVNHYDSNPQVRSLLDAKTFNEEGKEVYAYSGNFIKNYINETNISETKKYLMSLMSNSKNKLLSEEEILNLIIQKNGAQNANMIIDFCKNNPQYTPILKLFASNVKDLSIYKNCLFYTANTAGETVVNKKMCDFFIKHLSGFEGYYSVKTPYIKDCYELNLINQLGGKNIRFKLNKDGLPHELELENIINSGKKKIIEHKFKDGSCIKQEVNYGTYYGFEKEATPIAQATKKEFYNSANELVYSEEIVPSTIKPGEFEIIVNKNGKKEIVGYVRQYGSKGQGTRIGRKLVSPDGTITKQVKIEGPKGGSSKYIITDKNGNIITNISRKHRKITENHYTSKVNNETYDMEFLQDTIKVKKFDASGNLEREITLTSEDIDFSAIELYKKLPGDYFIKLKDMGYKIQKFPNCKEIQNAGGAYCAYEEKLIAISEQAHDPFVFAHEIGHAIDYSLLDLRKDSTLIKIFQKELENYKKVSSSTEGQFIDYFTTLQHYNPDGCITEAIAETNALLSGLNQTKNATNMVGLRSVTLQQNFPETIAYLANRISNKFRPLKCPHNANFQKISFYP